MRTSPKPLVSFFLAFATVVVSCFVALKMTGSVLGKVNVTDLINNGAVTVEHLKNFELWRLFSAQIVHVSQIHMLYNALCLLVLGAILERRVGHAYVLAIWFFAGAFGTLFTNFFGTAPWNAGTGASQAVLGLSGFGIVLMWKKIDASIALMLSLGLTVIPAFSLDFAAVGYPKPGHVFGILMGALIGFDYVKRHALVTQVARPGK